VTALDEKDDSDGGGLHFLAGAGMDFVVLVGHNTYALPLLTGGGTLLSAGAANTLV